MYGTESVPYVLLFVLYDIAMRHLDFLRMGLHTTRQAALARGGDFTDVSTRDEIVPLL
jgi:hypothetical protein